MTDIVQYQGASGDLNPMHHDDPLARSVGYPAAFSVGMLGAGYLATFCTDVYGPENVRRFRTRFREVVYRGEILTAQGTVSRCSEIDGERRVEIDFALLTAAGRVAVEGSAEFVIG